MFHYRKQKSVFGPDDVSVCMMHRSLTEIQSVFVFHFTVFNMFSLLNKADIVSFFQSLGLSVCLLTGFGGKKRENYPTLQRFYFHWLKLHLECSFPVNSLSVQLPEPHESKCVIHTVSIKLQQKLCFTHTQAGVCARRIFRMNERVESVWVCVQSE